MDRPTFTVIGYGNVGAALSSSLKDAGYSVLSIYNRTDRDIEGVRRGLPERAEDLGDIVFITVSDQSVGQVAEMLSGLDQDLSTRCFLHCSGTLSSEELRPFREKGAATASFHPMMAVKPDTRSFADITFDGEGDEEAIQVCRRIASDLKARFMEVSAEKRIYLHAASVVASNYLVSLTELALNISKGSGRPDSELLQSLLPLIRSTLQNLEKGSTAEALTGPIARGDADLIKKHLKILQDTTDEGKLYRMLGRYTLGLLSDEEAKNLEELFLE